ncbi:MAG TPA: helix-turn-helix domain-containing protein [Mucilaginibacter sp.]|nr:helix-turn-helix domain-containing protein [Mucilaginibacter sp.]
MKSGNIIPNQKIASHVDRILVIESAPITTPFILPLYANGVPTVLFKSVKGNLGKDNSNHLLLFGQTVLPESLTLTEEFTLIAYFFKPFTLIPLFGVPAQELTDKPIDLNLIFPSSSAELQERLLNAGSVKNMICLLDDFVFNLINHSKTEYPSIKYATTQIASNPSKESLAAVQKELHITERTFQRRFERNVGIAPNLYRRICQFNAAFIQLNNKSHHKLSDIAFQHGYADQSHYIRAFREFTHITPKEYLRFGSDL